MTVIDAPAVTSAAGSRRDFLFYLAGRGLANVAYRAMMVAVGWQIYDLTNDALALGYVGLALFLPVAACILPAGDVADRVDRRLVLTLGYGVAAIAAGLLLALTLADARNQILYYAVLV